MGTVTYDSTLDRVLSAITEIKDAERIISEC